MQNAAKCLKINKSLLFFFNQPGNTILKTALYSWDHAVALRQHLQDIVSTISFFSRTIHYYSLYLFFTTFKRLLNTNELLQKFTDISVSFLIDLNNVWIFWRGWLVLFPTALFWYRGNSHSSSMFTWKNYLASTFHKLSWRLWSASTYRVNNPMQSS